MIQKSLLHWHQGLFLQPQHFQLESQFHQSHANRLNCLFISDGWGVNHLHIQEDALIEGRIVITHGELLFPDGSLCCIPENATVCSRRIEADQVVSGQPLKLFLGISEWKYHEANVTEIENNTVSETVSTRFYSSLSPEEIPDLHGDGTPAEVRKLSYVIKVFSEDEISQRSDYHFIPIAILERKGADIRLRYEFIPPLLNVHQWPALSSLLNGINDQVLFRVRQMEKFKRVGKQITEDETVDAATLISVQVLAQCAWEVQNLIEMPVLHPRVLWSGLCSIIARLSCFVSSLSVTGVAGADRWPAYNHSGLEEVFSQLHTQLCTALKEMATGPEFMYAMNEKNSVWQCEPEAEIFDQNHCYWLFFDNCDAGKFQQDLARIIKLSSTEELPDLVARSVSGIPLIPVDKVPFGLPVVDSGIYCRIENESPLWEKVVASKHISLFWPVQEDTQVIFYVTQRQSV